MIKYNRSTSFSLGMVVLSILLVSCDVDPGSEFDAEIGAAESDLTIIDVSEASIVTQASKVSGAPRGRDGSGFDFPIFTEEGGNRQMVIPDGALPVFPARRTLSEGTGQIVSYGEPVTLKYDMFSWREGKLVESSSWFEEAITVDAGVANGFPAIPEYLASSLYGRKRGDIIQVILPVGTTDIPEDLDTTDAHVLVVELL